MILFIGLKCDAQIEFVIFTVIKIFRRKIVIFFLFLLRLILFLRYLLGPSDSELGSSTMTTIYVSSKIFKISCKPKFCNRKVGREVSNTLFRQNGFRFGAGGV